MATWASDLGLGAAVNLMNNLPAGLISGSAVKMTCWWVRYPGYGDRNADAAGTARSCAPQTAPTEKIGGRKFRLRPGRMRDERHFAP